MTKNFDDKVGTDSMVRSGMEYRNSVLQSDFEKRKQLALFHSQKDHHTFNYKHRKAQGDTNENR